MNDRKQEAILNGMRRRLGMSAAKRVEVDAANANMVWTATCPKCHKTLQGTPDQLKAHRCE